MVISEARSLMIELGGKIRRDRYTTFEVEGLQPRRWRLVVFPPFKEGVDIHELVSETLKYRALWYVESEIRVQDEMIEVFLSWRGGQAPPVGSRITVRGTTWQGWDAVVTEVIRGWVYIDAVKGKKTYQGRIRPSRVRSVVLGEKLTIGGSDDEPARARRARMAQKA